ncbi:OmpA family protein [Rubrivirga sp.]|uniref:OmpA family protein n=1 Tax=Rubrivirga sp. TaxID=1885344 RepID=UPI003C7764FE
MLRLTALALALALTGCANTLDRAMDRAGNVAERAVNRNIDSRTDRAINGAIDGTFQAGENAVRCTYDDRACVERAQSRGDSVVLVDREGTPVDRNGTPVTEGNVEDAVIRTTVSNANANYDFTPGERALFEDDFDSDRLGDFPRRLHYLAGTSEVVDFQGQRFLRFTSGGGFEVRLGQTLPSTFTIEFDYQGDNDAYVNMYTAPRTSDNDTRPFSGYDGARLSVGSWRGSGVWNSDGPVSVVRIPHDELTKVEITVDDQYVKMYADGARVANVPRADIGRHDAITFQVGARSDRLVYIGDLRIAAGGNDLYGALEAEGRVVTEGILFNTGSATLQPESFSVVQEIASMMEEHPGLRVRVEGHTDNTGNASSNQSLSERRAEAVRTMLIGLGVSAGRVEAAGMGASRPIADNGTPEGQRQNRRVELVRL